MRVSEIMSQEIVTISPDKRVGQALQLMQKHQIRHLPVLEGRPHGGLDHLPGPAGGAAWPPCWRRSRVADVMIKAPLSVTPDTGWRRRPA